MLSLVPHCTLDQPDMRHNLITSSIVRRKCSCSTQDLRYFKLQFICLLYTSYMCTGCSCTSDEHATAKRDKKKETYQRSRTTNNEDIIYTHAIPAACSVEIKPHIIALGPIRAMRRVREGASAASTPICMPSDPRLANPQSAYDAMVKPRVESASFDAINACSSRYAANSFSTSLVASSSETRIISARGTPVSGACEKMAWTGRAHSGTYQ
jgi:hypothetical protein